MPSSSRTTRILAPGLPDLDYTKYAVPNCTESKDGVEVVTTDVALNTDPAALTRFIRDQVSLPPLPYVRIVGSNSVCDSYGRTADFDIKLNMLRYFLGERSRDGGGVGWNYVKLGGEGELPVQKEGSPSSLGAWAQRYCNDNCAVKSYVAPFHRKLPAAPDSERRFTLTRQTTNWNTSFLEGQIRNLVAATGFEGQVTVSFPAQYARVIVQPPRSGIEGFFTTMFSPLMAKKRYEVVGVWPYASLPPGTEAGRVCAVQTEEDWWEEWKEVLRRAVVKRNHGFVFVDDLLALKMSPRKE